MGKEYTSQFTAAEVEEALDSALNPEDAVRDSRKPIQAKAVKNAFDGLATIDGHKLTGGGNIEIAKPLVLFDIDENTGELYVVKENLNDRINFEVDDDGNLVVVQ